MSNAAAPVTSNESAAPATVDPVAIPVTVKGNEAKGTYQGSTLTFKSGMNLSEFARANSMSEAKAEGLYKGFRRLCWLAFVKAAESQKIVAVKHGAKWDRTKKAWVATTTIRHEGGKADKGLAAIALAKTKSQVEANLANMADALNDLS